MTPQEKEAFVKAYSTNVASVSDDDVRVFLNRVDSGEDVDYSHDYTSIMDALGMWHDAINWHLRQTKEALTLSLSELHRHAADTESGDKAIDAVEKVLK